MKRKDRTDKQSVCVCVWGGCVQEQGDAVVGGKT